MDAFVDAVPDELEGQRLPSWRSPFHWWGPTWGRPDRRSLADLVADEVLDAATGERLQRHVEAGESITVAAGPSRVGKSTLADALARELPADVERIYVRGSYETFDFAGVTGAHRTALLVNEISPHLPVYLWGPAARRVLGMARDGGQVIATMHADSPEEVIYQLARQPVGATQEEIAALGTVAFLEPPKPDGGDRWRMGRVVRLRATGQGIRVEEFA